MAEATRRAAERARLAVLALLAAMVVSVVGAVAVDAASPQAAVALVALLLVPLLLPVRGLWRRDRRTFAWATLCLTPHFTYALTEMVANPAVRPLAATIFLLGFALLVALVAYLRLTRGSG